MKIKENEKRLKYLSRELKKLLNMKVTVILILICALGKIPKRLVKGQEKSEIEGQMLYSHIIQLHVYI